MSSSVVTKTDENLESVSLSMSNPNSIYLFLLSQVVLICLEYVITSIIFILQISEDL